MYSETFFYRYMFILCSHNKTMGDMFIRADVFIRDKTVCAVKFPLRVPPPLTLTKYHPTKKTIKDNLGPI